MNAITKKNNVKNLKINFEGKKYVLEYTREAAVRVEAQGFVFEELFKKPNINIPLLVRGAFISQHPNTDIDVIDRLFENIEDKKTFLNKLITMYEDTLNSLTAEPTKGEEGNATWEASW